MQVAITSHQIEVTPALSAYIHQRLERLKNRIYEATHVVVAIAGKKKNGVVPSITIFVYFAREKTIVVKEYLSKTAKDFYTIVGAAFDTLANGFETRAGKIDKKHQRERTNVLRNKSFALA
ncbi:MAG: HPF/RaiA family ribosome-associated protein [Minisyncoccia bacterium]